MTLTKFFVFSLVVTSILFASQQTEPSIPVHDPSGRQLCTTLTQSQQVRFESCMNGEVMTGIRSLDPLMVYCTRLLANCINRDDSKNERAGHQSH